jgi:hypothetical protein
VRKNSLNFKQSNSDYINQNDQSLSKHLRKNNSNRTIKIKELSTKLKEEAF